MGTWILTPLLMIAVALVCAGCAIGLAVLGHVAGPVGLGAGLFSAFLAAWLTGVDSHGRGRDR
jgi:succinate-acetate transporter protein